MMFRRFALAIGLLFAALTSQLPEYTQQYRQRLGGAIDELSAMIQGFDQEAAGQSLSHDQGVARLKSNPDVLAQERGSSVEGSVERRDRLARQKQAFATAGPLSQYAVLAEDFDAGIARQAYGDFQPALPATPSGLVSALVGLAIGWLLAHLVSIPMRGRRATPLAPQTTHTWR